MVSRSCRQQIKPVLDFGQLQFNLGGFRNDGVLFHGLDVMFNCVRNINDDLATFKFNMNFRNDDVLFHVLDIMFMLGILMMNVFIRLFIIPCLSLSLSSNNTINYPFSDRLQKQHE